VNAQAALPTSSRFSGGLSGVAVALIALIAAAAAVAAAVFGYRRLASGRH
jgi:hypothetical protein